MTSTVDRLSDLPQMSHPDRLDLGPACPRAYSACKQLALLAYVRSLIPAGAAVFLVGDPFIQPCQVERSQADHDAQTDPQLF